MEQLLKLRNLMQQKSVAALIVPSTDPHSSEYVAKHWLEREFVSGFTGSAGTAVIGLNGGALWTDSRYFLQAEQQLKNSGLLLQKEGVEGTPTIAQYLVSQLSSGDKVAINPLMIDLNSYRNLRQELSINNIELFTDFDFVDAVWENRPSLPDSKVFVFDEKYCGESVESKLARLRAKMLTDNLLLTALDDIAWLFNIRGGDIDFNPVVISYALIDKQKAALFVDSNKIDGEVREHLNKYGVEVRCYEDILDELKRVNTSITIDPAKCNYSLYKAIPQGVKILEQSSLITPMKAIKNEKELANIEDAMRKDGVALVRFWMWVEKQLKAKNRITELDCVNKLHECRAQQEGFVTESFATISAYKEHGAIVHYEVDESSDVELKEESFLLLDSGGQYLTGTTDITRTVALGTPTDQMKFDYTLVLKGHLALGHQLFPAGTRGTQLDAIARQFLWNNEMQFGHGTGHGVGFFLNVHEGPHGIRMNEIPVPLQVGMVVSNEPGVYRAGVHGVRIENLIAVAEYPDNVTEFGHFLHFRPLTLFPYDRYSIEISLLTPDELLQINYYHHYVYSALAPLLNSEEQEWLRNKTARM